MPVQNIILHIGKPKCASSSIQTFLSYNPVIKINNKNYMYFVIKSDSILLGDKITVMSQKSPQNYQSSICPTRNLSAWQNALKNAIEYFQKTPDYFDLVISSEHLTFNQMPTNFFDLLDNFSVGIRIFMVVRDPISYFNSAYWQWGVWDGLPQPYDWYLKNKDINYINSLLPFIGLNSLKNYQVVDLSENVVEQFFLFTTGTELTGDFKVPVANRSSSPNVLHLLLNNPDSFRRYTHAPEIEFLINKKLKQSTSSAPKVVNQKMASMILDNFLQNDYDILHHISETSGTQLDHIHKKYTCTEENNKNVDDSFCIKKFLDAPYEKVFIEDFICSFLNSN